MSTPSDILNVVRLSVASLRSLVRLSLITEGRIENLTAKHPDIAVASLAASDPSPTKKYLEWMVKQAATGAKEEDIATAIKHFHANAHKLRSKDINSYKTLAELEVALSVASQKKTRGETKKTITSTEAPKIYEDDNLIVIRPDTKRACIKYGQGTKWCITMDSDMHYEDYTSENVIFYFVLSKVKLTNKDNEKIACAVYRNKKNEMSDWEVYNAADKLLNGLISAYDNEDNSSLERSAKSAYNVITVDVNRVPKSFIAKIKSGDDVTPRELVAHWLALGDSFGSKLHFIHTVRAAYDDKFSVAETRRRVSQMCSVLAQVEKQTDLHDVFVSIARDPESANIDREHIVYYNSDGQVHRDGDKPAKIYSGQRAGERVWYKNGEIHRDGEKPARITATGKKYWYNNGRLYFSYDKRIGQKTWFSPVGTHGRVAISRLDGPAVIDTMHGPDEKLLGTKPRYYVDNKEYSKKTWEKKVKKMYPDGNVPKSPEPDVNAV